MAKKKEQAKQIKQATTDKKQSVAGSPVAATRAQSPLFSNMPLLMGILAIAVLLAFVGAFGNDFINYDDNAYVTGNSFIQTPSIANLITLLKVECAFNYHPLTMASYWLNARLFGHGASSYIITNTAIHILNTLLIFLLTRKLTKGNNWVAFFTALIWGVSPLRNESVTWISERKDVLYTFFFMLSSIKYIDFIQSDKKKYLVYSFVFFVLSCLAKGMAVVLPLVLILLDYWFDKEWLSVKRLLQKAPFFIVSVLFGILTIIVQSGGTLGGRIQKLSGIGDSAIHSKLSFLQRFIFGFYGFWVYIFKTFIPYGLHNYYNYPRPEHYYDAQYVLAPVLAIALLVFAARMYRREKIFFFGVMYFFATIIIVLQFIAVGDNMLSERYSYIPSFGLIFMAVYWLSGKLKQATLTAAFSAVAAIFIFITYQQTLTYKDTGSVFLNSYKYAPTSTVVNEFVMDHYGEQGDYQEVLSYGETALENNVVSFKIFVRLAKAFYFMGDTTKAMAIWKEAIPMSPEKDKKSVYCERGMMYRAMGRYQESIVDFDSAISLNRLRYTKQFKGVIHYERGLTYRLAGDYPDAVADFSDAIKYNSASYDSAIKEKAYAELLAKQWQEARTDYTAMISKGIAKDTAYYNRGCAFYNLGQKQDAINDLQQAVKINPGYQQAKDNLAQLQQMK